MWDTVGDSREYSQRCQLVNTTRFERFWWYLWMCCKQKHVIHTAEIKHGPLHAASPLVESIWRFSSCCKHVTPENLLLCSSYVKGKPWTHSGPYCTNMFWSNVWKRLMTNTEVQYVHNILHRYFMLFIDPDSCTTHLTLRLRAFWWITFCL